MGSSGFPATIAASLRCAKLNAVDPLDATVLMDECMKVIGPAVAYSHQKAGIPLAA